MLQDILTGVNSARKQKANHHETNHFQFSDQASIPWRHHRFGFGRNAGWLRHDRYQ